jgi:hypothetical protein
MTVVESDLVVDLEGAKDKGIQDRVEDDGRATLWHEEERVGLRSLVR